MKKDWVLIIGIIAMFFVLTFLVLAPKTRIANPETPLLNVNDFINRVRQTTQKLNDILLRTNKTGDLIQEKYADINDTKDAQRIKEYLELRDCLGQASAELRKAITVLPEALKTPLDTANLLPMEEHLKMAELILKYIEMRLSD